MNATPPTYAFWTRTDRDTVALIDPDGAQRTVGQVQDGANRLAHALRAAGVQKGDVVAYCMHNSAAVFELVLATSQIGVYYTPINWHLTPHEIRYILKDSGARVVIASADLAEACAGTPAEVWALGADGQPNLPGFKALPTDPPEDRAAGGVMTYTSGTTGSPKGVKRPLPPAPPEPVASAFAMFLFIYGMRGGEGVHIVTSPLYHTAVVYFASCCLHLGQQVVIMEKFTAEGMLERIERYRVSNSHMVPTQLVRLLEVQGKERYDVSSLRHMIHGAAPCPAWVKRAMLEWWGPVLYEYYAASEGGGTVVSSQEWLARPGTVGKPWPTADVKILSDGGDELAPGEVGTVWIKMAQPFEYHGDQDKTRRAWRGDGYFTVGDAGYKDADGYLYLCDRKADLIISGGVNIYPAEVEAVLIEHPRVRDVAVFGIPDDAWGEQVKAVVEVSGDVEPDLEASLLGWASERLAKFKRPRSIDFTDALPRDPNGKLKKRSLRDPYWEGRGGQI